jgi:cytochrome c553
VNNNDLYGRPSNGIVRAASRSGGPQPSYEVIVILLTKINDFSLIGLILLLLAPWTAGAAELNDTVALCTSCHGEEGTPIEPDMPILWGQEFYYIYVQLKDYKAERRHSEVMNDVVAELSKSELKEISQYFSEKPWPRTGFQSTRDDVAKGEMAATAGQCFQCHIGKYMGDSSVPRLAGQQLGYLERTMLEFKNKIRRNSPAKGSLFATFDDVDIEALARYLAGL